MFPHFFSTLRPDFIRTVSERAYLIVYLALSYAAPIDRPTGLRIVFIACVSVFGRGAVTAAHSAAFPRKDGWLPGVCCFMCHTFTVDHFSLSTNCSRLLQSDALAFWVRSHSSTQTGGRRARQIVTSAARASALQGALPPIGRGP